MKLPDLSEFELSEFISICRDHLALSGYTTQQVPLLTPALEEEILAAGKPFISPNFSTRLSDFTHENGFWVTLRHEGRLVGTVAARVDRIGHEAFGDYLERVFSKQYPMEDGPSVKAALPGVLAGVHGDIVYMGDMYFHPEHRGNIAKTICFVRAAFGAVFMKWQSVGMLFAFQRYADDLAGKVAQYGFCSGQYQGVIEWRDPPDWRSSTEVLSVLEREEFMRRAGIVLRNPYLITDPPLRGKASP